MFAINGLYKFLCVFLCVSKRVVLKLLLAGPKLDLIENEKKWDKAMEIEPCHLGKVLIKNLASLDQFAQEFEQMLRT